MCPSAQKSKRHAEKGSPNHDRFNRPDGSEPQQTHENTVMQVATELGVSVYVVYYWIEQHHVDARRGPGGRWLVNFDTTTEAECRRRIASSTQIKTKSQPKTSWPRTRRQYEATCPSAAQRVDQMHLARPRPEQIGRPIPAVARFQGHLGVGPPRRPPWTTPPGRCRSWSRPAPRRRRSS